MVSCKRKTIETEHFVPFGISEVELLVNSFLVPFARDVLKHDLSGNTYPDAIAQRLSSQQVNGKYERRYYGASLFYSNPNASSSTVDVVQYVADPQIFVPFDEKTRMITDPDLPDFVVSVTVTLQSQAPGEDSPTIKTYTHRYIPKVVMIDAADVQGIYEKIAAKSNGGMSPSYVYTSLDEHKRMIKNYSDQIKSKLNP